MAGSRPCLIDDCKCIAFDVLDGLDCDDESFDPLDREHTLPNVSQA